MLASLFIAALLTVVSATPAGGRALKPVARPALASSVSALKSRSAPARPGAVSGARPSSAKKRVAPKPRVVELVHVNSKETLRLRYTDERGRPIKGLQKVANRFFRCHHTNTQGRMNARLLRLLFDVGRHWPGQRLEVVSGYRHPTVAKNPHSPHMKGLACDFRVVGVKNTELRDYLRRALSHVGVGYYPNSSFVHLDVRQGASAFWIDYSGPGANALYSDNPSEDLRSGRADSFKPTTIDPAWAEQDEPPPSSAATTGATGQASAEAAPAAAPGPAAEFPQVQ